MKNYPRNRFNKSYIESRKFSRIFVSVLFFLFFSSLCVSSYGAENEEVEGYDFTAVMKDVTEAIRGSNENIKKNKDVYLEGLEAAKLALKQKRKIADYINNDPDFQQVLGDYQETTKSILEEHRQEIQKKQKLKEIFDKSKKALKNFFDQNPIEMRDWLEKIKDSELPKKIKEKASLFLSNLGDDLHNNIDSNLAIDIISGAVGTGAVSYFLCELMLAASGFVVGPAGTVTALMAGHPFCVALGAAGVTAGGLSSGLKNIHLMDGKKKSGNQNVAKKGKKKPSSSQIKKFQNQLKKHGKDSLEKSKSSLQKRLLEHKQKLEMYKKENGFTSSIEREIKNFENELEAIDQVLGGNNI